MYRIDEPIALLELRYNYQPRTFRWRGMTHAINLVERLGGVVAGVSLLIELAFLNGRALLPGYDVHSLIVY